MESAGASAVVVGVLIGLVALTFVLCHCYRSLVNRKLRGEQQPTSTQQEQGEEVGNSQFAHHGQQENNHADDDDNDEGNDDVMGNSKALQSIPLPLLEPNSPTMENFQPSGINHLDDQSPPPPRQPAVLPQPGQSFTPTVSDSMEDSNAAVDDLESGKMHITNHATTVTNAVDSEKEHSGSGEEEDNDKELESIVVMPTKTLAVMEQESILHDIIQIEETQGALVDESSLTTEEEHEMDIRSKEEIADPVNKTEEIDNKDEGKGTDQEPVAPPVATASLASVELVAAALEQTEQQEHGHSDNTALWMAGRAASNPTDLFPPTPQSEQYKQDDTQEEEQQQLQPRQDSASPSSTQTIVDYLVRSRSEESKEKKQFGSGLHDDDDDQEEAPPQYVASDSEVSNNNQNNKNDNDSDNDNDNDNRRIEAAAEDEGQESIEVEVGQEIWSEEELADPENNTEEINNNDDDEGTDQEPAAPLLKTASLTSVALAAAGKEQTKHQEHENDDPKWTMPVTNLGEDEKKETDEKEQEIHLEVKRQQQPATIKLSGWKSHRRTRFGRRLKPKRQPEPRQEPKLERDELAMHVQTALVNAPTQEEMEALFVEMDKNGDGKLSLKEVEKAMFQRLAPQFDLKPAIVLRAFQTADLNGNGHVDKEEFFVFLRLIRYFDNLYYVFSLMDTDGDRHLSRQEFCNAADILGVQGDPHAVFEEMDEHLLGYIIFDDFCIWMAEHRATTTTTETTSTTTTRL
ncbi:hypothetical protein ACA910_019385 [Epithemia clementina (nom. ined.)]